MKTAFTRDLKLLMRKHPDRCSICKTEFDEEAVTYTVMGYDKYHRVQATSGCCADLIVNVKQIGLAGYFDPTSFEETMLSHPMYSTFMKKPLDA